MSVPLRLHRVKFSVIVPLADALYVRFRWIFEFDHTRRPPLKLKCFETEKKTEVRQDAYLIFGVAGFLSGLQSYGFEFTRRATRERDFLG